MPLVDVLGDGPTFHAKTRRIRFLHEITGFDLLVWDSARWDCGRTDAALDSAARIDDALNAGLFSIWTAGNLRTPADHEGKGEE